MIDKQFAERAPDTLTAEGCWYIPHHATFHPTKGSIRVVFNASKEYDGTSLNDQLIPGPSKVLTNSLSGILMRFRSGDYAFMADIEKMFYQVRIPECQRNLVRFFWWWDNECLSGEPVEYRMCVHLFGAVSSPACASYALRQCAKDFGTNFSEEAVNALLNEFYVDDLVKSCDSVPEAKRLISEVQELCGMGGFNLTKFSANNDELNKDVKLCDQAKADSVLGVKWSTDRDMLGIRIKLSTAADDGVITRRSMLRTLSAIYDPLGLASPFLLRGREILQTVTKAEVGWDDVVSEQIKKLWSDWITDLNSLKDIEIPRCYKSSDFGRVASAQIHAFADASESGYGCALYLRLENCRGQVEVSLIQGKSRVIPACGETIPRSELVAATLAAELGHCALSQLETVYGKMEIYYYTDSTVTLGYLRNQTKRFKTFVSNRVRKIKSLSKVDDWYHCDTENNPADDASRGLLARNVSAEHRWFKGPKFLVGENFLSVLNNVYDFSVSDSDPELKRNQVVCSATRFEKSEDPVLRIAPSVSDWFMMTRRIATVIAALGNVGKKVVNISVEDLRTAEVKVLRSVQNSQFSDEIKKLKSKIDILESSVLVTLSPFLDCNGLLRVGGRLEKCEVPVELKHPVIMPKFSKVTDAIIRDCHERVCHGGRSSTMNEIRSRGFWVIGLTSRVKCLIHKCVPCRVLRGQFGQQRMAHIPEDRLDYKAPPMTYCGVDVFGPFLVKNGRKEQKRYCALFTDLVYRGIHIETLNNLDTDSFLCALRRFVARRGNLRFLRSDNATNFHGSSNEMKKDLESMEPEVRKLLLKNGGDIEWRFNTPVASHHGGAWERKIGSARRVMEAVLKKHSELLNDQSFATSMTEVEAIVNSQPLTVESLTDPSGPVPLSPANILTQKSRVILPPPGKFDEKAELYCRKQWRRIQHLANEIWTRYRKEYLCKLQTTTKWTKERRNFAVGDVVILNDDSSHRNHWPLGLVVETYPDNRGLVRSVRIIMSRPKLKDAIRYLNRPITKLVLLVESEPD